MTANTSSADTATHRFALGEFVLDLEAGELFAAHGELAGLRKQALDVLLALGRRPGQVVSKDELMKLVWPDVVVTEGSLMQAVAEIRRVLGESGHRVVRNVARRGYMLVPDAVAATTPSAAIRPRWRGPALIAGLLLGMLLAAGSWTAWRSNFTAWQSPADLARTPLPREVPPLSIIVLPLALEGEAADAGWLADALHGDLVVAVARLHNSLVIARDTASTYKGKTVDPRQVAREMGVRHVIQGSLRREAEKVDLNVALIDGESGVQRWAGSFGVERAELARAVGDFAVAIERTLAGELYRSTVERRATLSPAEVTADDLAMQGFALWYRGITRENVLGAKALFDRALAMDPDSARAWAGVHFTIANMVFNSWTDDRDAALRRAEVATANLERLDRDGTYTYGARTFLIVQKHRDYRAMLRLTTEWTGRYRLPTAFGAHGMALVFNGRFDEAVQVLERALRLGPRDPFRAEWQYRLALAHFGAGRYELARDWSQTAAHTTPALSWPPIHAAALLKLGRREAAQQAFDEHMRRHPGFVGGQVKARIPSEEAAHSEMRSRMIDSLRELGMRD